MQQPPQNTNVQNTQNEPEKKVGEWKGTRVSPAFWILTIFTLGLYYLLVHRFNKITLTNRRVTQMRGNILSQNETTLSVTNVTNITVNQSVLGKLLNYGDITIESAGSSVAEIRYERLGNPIKLRELIYDLKDGRIDTNRL